jgi:hypothetical protein
MNRKQVPGGSGRIKNRIEKTLPYILFAGHQAKWCNCTNIPAQNIKLSQQTNIEFLYKLHITELSHRNLTENLNSTEEWTVTTALTDDSLGFTEQFRRTAQFNPDPD